MRAPKYSIILAAGKGTRMHSADLHKVCFEIDGKPAINRSLEVYSACGIAYHIIVVGAMAAQVMDTVTREHDNALFAYQAEQLGTAHAARQGARILSALDSETEVLIVAGDRIIESSVLERFFDLFFSQSCDLAFLSLPKKELSGLGRILLYPDQTVMGNLEAADIRQRQILRDLRTGAAAGSSGFSREEILSRIDKWFSKEQAAVAFGQLWEVLAQGGTPSQKDILEWIPEESTCFQFVDPNGKPMFLSPEDVEKTPWNNSSVYLVKSEALNYVLSRLDRNNAQGEEYLPDMITMLAQARSNGRPRFRVRTLAVTEDHAIMGFNNPAELLEIENHLRAQRATSPSIGGPEFRSLSGWIEAFRSLSSSGRSQVELRRELKALYGVQKLLEDRIQAYLHLLEYAAQVLDPQDPLLLVRSPGRVNMMGRHVDHQGGNCNLMTIGYETLLAVHPRQDDQVCLYNVEQDRFPDRSFSIGALVADLPWDDWISLINSEKVSNLVLNAGGDWSQYVKAAVLRLQKKFSHQRLRGVDLVVSGNIPVAAGLSSSSALVVATAEALVSINRLNTHPEQLVDLCGEGEWFVGTRGGSADHAAIKYGQRGKVVKVTFFDFAVEDIVAFPENHTLLVCDSGIKANKTTNARDQFNHRVACYRLGTLLIKKEFPQYAPLIKHLRDVNTRTLGIPLSGIYKILLSLPENMTRGELEERLPEENLDPLFDSHTPATDNYPIRGIVLYGLAECERSRCFADSLNNNRLEEIGRLMNASHDGDRVSRLREGVMSPYQASTDDRYFLGLIEDLESGQPDRVLPAQLQWQPGSYHCSVAEIDHMVDISRTIPGVLGAQLAGAGLGGCIMVLVHNDAFENLSEALKREYFRPYAKPVSILNCVPISGSTVLLAK